ncbi:MAG: molybdopterin-dependent oxidoreductase [Coriobacteriales bacterium]|jgi:DMSO/TMAO reductase YedYZ molybdopterin-dependent catalytic subunit|nr:molybdopterin-dependent oxidoreductase [Coriobacteriales bacterium]
MKNKKALILTASLALVAGVFTLSVVACAPQDTKDKDGQTTTPTDGLVVPYSLDAYDAYNPVVKTLADGTEVQRTPSEGLVFTTLDGSYTYHTPERTVPYNTYYLKADQKGCNACHSDLADTLATMEYKHVDLRNAMGLQVTVQMCKDCHTFGNGYLTNQYSFGSLVHGIHQGVEQAGCWNCHVGTGSGDGMQLWDEVKHGQLRGITPLAEVPGDFSYDQDKITAAEDLFDFGWDYFEWDYIRSENTANNTPLDQELFDTWTVTISGEVNQEVTYTLPELIEKFGGVTVPITLHCTLNPIGGPLIGNSNFTGVPLTKVLAEAGISPTAAGFTFMAPDGFTESIKMPSFSEAYFAYQIDGVPLSWAHGYPVTMVVPGAAAPASVKEVSDVVVFGPEEAAEIHEWEGWPLETEGDYYTSGGWPLNDANGYRNKPNVGLFDFVEGQIITIGEPYEFSGYATAYNTKIAAVEFSLDGGVNWTRYETPNVNTDSWVIWHLTYTPTDDSAYVLSIRSVGEDGSVTHEPLEYLFNAKPE